MARQESTARLVGYSRMVSDAVDQRLATADRVVNTLVLARRVTSKDVSAVQADLVRLMGGSSEPFDLVAIAAIDGRLIASVPRDALPARVGGQSFFVAVADVGLTQFRWQPASGKHKARAWMLHAVLGKAGKPYVLMARLHTEFLQKLADETASARDSRVALVISPAGQVVARGATGPWVDATKITYSSPIAAAGRSSASPPSRRYSRCRRAGSWRLLWVSFPSALLYEDLLRTTAT